MFVKDIYICYLGCSFSLLVLVVVCVCITKKNIKTLWLMCFSEIIRKTCQEALLSSSTCNSTDYWQFFTWVGLRPAKCLKLSDAYGFNSEKDCIVQWLSSTFQYAVRACVRDDQCCTAEVFRSFPACQSPTLSIDDVTSSFTGTRSGLFNNVNTYANTSFV